MLVIIPLGNSSTQSSGRNHQEKKNKTVWKELSAFSCLYHISFLSLAEDILLCYSLVPVEPGFVMGPNLLHSPANSHQIFSLIPILIFLDTLKEIVKYVALPYQFIFKVTNIHMHNVCMPICLHKLQISLYNHFCIFYQKCCKFIMHIHFICRLFWINHQLLAMKHWMCMHNVQTIHFWSIPNIPQLFEHTHKIYPLKHILKKPTSF